MSDDSFRNFNRPTRLNITCCRFQEEKRFLWYSIVQFFGMRCIVPANPNYLVIWVKLDP